MPSLPHRFALSMKKEEERIEREHEIERIKMEKLAKIEQVGMKWGSECGEVCRISFWSDMLDVL